jgi:hypothetical protein
MCGMPGDMKRLSAILPLGMLILTSCSTSHPLGNVEPRFYDTKSADIVVRYYSDNISRILKPLQIEGPFLTSFDKPAALELCKQQSGRDLAVVILLKFNASDAVKQNWLSPLKGMGYKRVVFLRAENGSKVDGLCVLENPTELTVKPAPPAERNVASLDAGGG